MNTKYLLLGMAVVLAAGSLSFCRAQTPPQPLPVPLIVPPKPALPKPVAEVVATNVARPKMVWCPACRGRKTVGVETEVACRSCAGTGKLKSGLSKAETVCNFCKGSGKTISLIPKPCPVCQAKGVLDAKIVEQFVSCTNCNGAKVLEVVTEIKCPTCGGTGKVVKGISGGGSFGGKGGGSSMSMTQEQPCPFCNASGTMEKKVRKVCPTCFGAGIVPPPPPPKSE